MAINDFALLSAKVPAYPMNSVSFRNSRLTALSRKLGISGSPQGEPFKLAHLEAETPLHPSGSRSTDSSMPCSAADIHTNAPSEADGPVKADPLIFDIETLKGLKANLHDHYGQTADDASWDPDLDLNEDGRIDIRDKRLVRDAQHDYKTLVRANYGKTTSDMDWDPDADLNGDGRVDIRDKRLVRDLLV